MISNFWLWHYYFSFNHSVKTKLYIKTCKARVFLYIQEKKKNPHWKIDIVGTCPNFQFSPLGTMVL